MKRKTFIYTLTDPRTNEVRYVGKTIYPKTRETQHSNIKNIEKNKSYYSFWILKLLKNGLKPIFEIIDETEDENWEWLEIYWIAQFKAWGFNLVNGTNGGEGASGMKLSLEARNKLSKAKKGKPLPKLYKKVYVYDSFGNFFKEYENIQECSKDLNINWKTITKSCKNNNKNRNNRVKYLFSFKKVDNLNKILKPEKKEIKYKCIEDDIYFSSMRDIFEKYHLSQKALKDHIENGTKLKRKNKTFIRI